MTRILTRHLWLAATCLTAASATAPVALGAEDPVDVRADEYIAEANREGNEPLLLGVEPQIVRRLSLAEAVALGVANNLDVEVLRFSPIIAGLEADAAWGAYDPVIDADYTYTDVDVPNANILQGQPGRFERDAHEGGATVGGLIPYVGATLGVQLRGDEETNSADQIFLLQPEWNASVTVFTTIPIMRGLIWNTPWTNVKTSQKFSDISQEEFRTRLMDTVEIIEVAYWNLVATKEQLRVERKSLETTEALLAQTQIEYEVGVKSRVDVVEAEAGVAERAFNVIVAENAYEESQDLLVDLILGTQLSGTSNLSFDTVDDPNEFDHRRIDVSKAVTAAMAQRPELHVADLQIERRELEMRFAKNQRLPQLDFRGSYTASGLAGDFPGRGAVLPDPGPPPTLGSPAIPSRSESFGQAWDNIGSDQRGDTYVAGAVFSVPFPNTTARKRATIAGLEHRRANTQKRRIEQQIIFEVRDTARTVESSYRGIEAAERRRLAAAEQLRAERIRLEHGESTPFDVLQRERDLVAAESQKIRALQSYRSSIAALERAQGTILEAHDVVIEPGRARR